MAKTPFFGPFSVTRSSNVADNVLTNIFCEIVETKDGKNVGALYGTAGLDLFGAAGAGPINGERTLNAVLYVVSGLNVYSVTTGGAATLLGAISGNGSRVAMTDNGTQLLIATNTNVYVAPGGQPFTGASIGAEGVNFGVGDTIVLEPVGGAETAATILQVLTITGAGGVATFEILQAGAYSSLPSSFTQADTSGSGSGFVLNSPTFGSSVGIVPVFLPFTPAGTITMSVTYQDGFGLLAEPGTINIWQSNIFDLSIWDALDFAEATAHGDTVVAVASLHRQLYVTKTTTSEVWVNAGTEGFAFQTLPSVLIESGCAAWGTLQRVSESLFMLAYNSQGQGIVRELRNYEPKKISTFAIDNLIQSLPTISDAFAYTYQQLGHQLYVLCFPTGNTTLVYDYTSSELMGEPIWYQWLYFSNGQFGRHLSNAGAFFNGQTIVGDYTNGNLYVVDPNTLTDNGQTISRIRRWRASPQAVMQPVRFSSLQLDMQTGIGVVTTNPQIMLRWSDDGGHVWAPQVLMSAGKLGQTAWRVRANRLGSTRRNSGLDRIFEVSVTDQIPVCFIGAEVNV